MEVMLLCNFFPEMYKIIIVEFDWMRFSCDIQNNQGLGKCYQLKQKAAEADNTICHP